MVALVGLGLVALGACVGLLQMRQRSGWAMVGIATAVPGGLVFRAGLDGSSITWAALAYLPLLGAVVFVLARQLEPDDD